MKLTLMIEASATVMARVLAAIGDGDAVVVTNNFTLAGAVSPAALQAITAEDDDGPTNPTAPDVDAKGIPWDERIHSGNHALNKDGTWRSRRGVDDATIQAVETELKGQAAPAPVSAPLTPMPMAMPTPAPVEQQPAPVPMPMAMPVEAAPAPVPTPMPAPEPVPVAAEMNFAEFMTKLGPNMAAGKIDTDYLMNVVQRINQHYGTTFNAVTDMSTRPDIIAQTVALMTSEGRWS